MSSGTNAVIYARFSSDGQRDESIEGQVRDCRAYAERSGLTVIGIYADRAISGTTDRRPEFQRMIRDASRGQFQTVLVWKLDRFARNRYDAAVYKARLKNYGVHLTSAKEAIAEGPEGIILESVLEGFAEYYSANLSQNVKRGYYDSALQLKTLGRRMLGYRTGPDGRFAVDPDTAPTVQEIFRRYAAGESAADICADLNRRGLKTYTGGTFNRNSIRRIIQNEKYIGVYRYADILVEDGVPALVSRDVYDQAQHFLKLHGEKPALKKEEGGFLLTGKLFCGHCGQAMTGDQGTSKSGKVYSYYTCVSARKHKCDKKRVCKATLEDTVVSLLAAAVCSDALIQAFADAYMRWQDEMQEQDRAAGFRARLSENQKATDNIVSVIEQGVVSGALTFRLRELEAERRDLEGAIAIAEIETPRLSREDVVSFLRQFQGGDPSDARWRIYLVDTFLQRAWLYDDGRLHLQLNFSGDCSEIDAQTAAEVVESGEALCSAFAPPGPLNGAKLNIYGFNGIFVLAALAR